jgi:ribose transport system permease protein
MFCATGSALALAVVSQGPPANRDVNRAHDILDGRRLMAEPLADGQPEQQDLLLPAEVPGHTMPIRALFRATQEQIVFAISIVLFVIFAVTLRGFLAADNLLSLVQNVSILGVLGFGMALAIIGRGIDLAIVTTMVMSTAWMLDLLNHGMPIPAAILAGLGFAVLIGLVVGVLIAYVEVPAIFATLAMSSVIYGFSRMLLVGGDIVFLPKSAGGLRDLGTGFVLGVPAPVILFLLVGVVGHGLLSFTKPGRFIRGMGDNPLRARIAGIPVRPMILLQHVVSSVIGFFAGVIMAALIGSMNTRLVNSTMVYDVILVVVLGGVGLSGGRGGVRNVFVGTLLIGILLNGMTILDIPYIMQNLIKGVILLVAIIIDTLLNPRDEQTSQQGDI